MGFPINVRTDVMTEARRLARAIRKAELKANGVKLSHYDSKEITKYVNQTVTSDYYYIYQAQVNLEVVGPKPITMENPANVR